MSSDFNVDPTSLAVTGWEATTQKIRIPGLPFDLHITVEDEPAFVDLTDALDLTEPAFLLLHSSSAIRFRDEGIEIDGQHLPGPMVLGETVHPSAEITVAGVAPTTQAACSHGFSPPQICPLWPH
jgi:hypothetical protein